MKYLFGGLLALIATFLLLSSNQAGEKKITIKDVMKNCMANPLCKKMAAGTATPDEQKSVLTYVVALGACEPKKGDAASWKAKTKALAEAAKANDAAAWKAAANCAACHKEHK